MKVLYWRMLPLLFFMGLVFFFWRGLSLDPGHLPSSQLGKDLPSFRLPVLGDPNVELTSATFRGQVTLLNVWASWCHACTEEQYFLLKLAREGVTIYGMNYKDRVEDAKDWLTTWGNPYRLVGEDVTGRVGIDLGVYGTPETFLIDKRGVIRYRHAGALTEVVWQNELLPLMKQWEQSA
jgi:cytochrome c biogenesis protein CcmG/thiol:disulfide interchange protein DsbE